MGYGNKDSNDGSPLLLFSLLFSALLPGVALANTFNIRSSVAATSQTYEAVNFQLNTSSNGDCWLSADTPNGHEIYEATCNIVTEGDHSYFQVQVESPGLMSAMSDYTEGNGNRIYFTANSTGGMNSVPTSINSQGTFLLLVPVR